MPRRSSAASSGSSLSMPPPQSAGISRKQQAVARAKTKATKAQESMEDEDSGGEDFVEVVEEPPDLELSMVECKDAAAVLDAYTSKPADRRLG